MSGVRNKANVVALIIYLGLCIAILTKPRSFPDSAGRIAFWGLFLGAGLGALLLFKLGRKSVTGKVGPSAKCPECQAPLQSYRCPSCGYSTTPEVIAFGYAPYLLLLIGVAIYLLMKRHWKLG